ncbi:hypothetical protein HYV71_01680 [Candidatus Uhrbacteria bacterium]|nr:hypothetical protein [Candidatus Uhrbacteria bacterium]
MKQESKPHIYLFWGDDRFSIGERLVYWKNEFLKKYGGHTLWYQDASLINDSAEFERRLRTAFRSSTLFTQPQLTILKDCDELPITAIETLASLLAHIPTRHFVVLTAKKYEKKKPLFAALEPLQKNNIAAVQEYRTPTGSALIAWAKKRFASKTKEIDDRTLQYLLSTVLADLTGRTEIPDLGILAHEIDKLCSFAASSPITCSLIDQIVSGADMTRLFDLEDAVLRQDRERALRIASALSKERKERGKNAFIGIISFLSKDIRGLLLIQAGHNPASWSPQRLWHAKRKIGSLGTDRLRCIYKKLLLCELSLKSSSLNAGMLLDSFLTVSTDARSLTPLKKSS